MRIITSYLKNQTGGFILYVHNRAPTCSNNRDAFMPAKSQWQQQLPEILRLLTALPSPVVDRAVIENLFGVGRRRAILLLHEFGGFRSGQTFFVDRPALIQRLEEIRDGGAFQAERARRNRLAQDLERTRQLAPGRKVRIAAAEDVRDRRLADLPAGIHLKPGELRIEFFGTEDLLRHLFELSQAILNDYKRFQEIVEEYGSLERN